MLLIAVWRSKTSPTTCSGSSTNQESTFTRSSCCSLHQTELRWEVLPRVVELPKHGFDCFCRHRLHGKASAAFGLQDENALGHEAHQNTSSLPAWYQPQIGLRLSSCFQSKLLQYAALAHNTQLGCKATGFAIPCNTAHWLHGSRYAH